MYHDTKKGVVAAGHDVTAEAAIEILLGGGNAYDAILSAYLTACVVEPALTSLGGGGYLLAHTSSNENILYDFFVQTPHSRNIDKKSDFFPVVVNFGAVTQEFHVGHGSIAVPGGVKGIFEIHKELGSVSLKRIIEPAVRAANKGVVINAFQAYVLDLLEPIFKSTPESFEIYKSLKKSESLLTEGEVLKNNKFANFLTQLEAQGEELFYKGEVANAIVDASKKKGGYITHEDLENYKVERRKPLEIAYRNEQFITNPPPSSGGILIAFALKMIESVDIAKYDSKSFEYIKLLADIMAVTNKARAESVDGFLHKEYISKDFLDSELLEKYRNEVNGTTNYMGNTTHISVIDEKGNCASMTTSNGEGSGFIIPGTGIMLNNMLGEEDLHPNGFHKWKENERISSMMSPSILLGKNGKKIVLGSGGSNRIRTAILQVILNYLDFDMNIVNAVDSSRIHFEKGRLNIESGFSDAEILKLKDFFEDVSGHGKKDVFFGGVHAVVQDEDDTLHGTGDVRRNGSTKHI